MKVYMVAIAIVLLTGCQESKRDFDERNKIKQCSDTGGIPILSEWDGRLTNCIYPPSK